MGRKKIVLPADLLAERFEINNALMAKFNRDEDIELIHRLVDHLVNLDNYIERLQVTAYNNLKNKQEMKNLYKEILNSYRECSEQEIRNIKWILQNRLSQKSKRNQE